MRLPVFFVAHQEPAIFRRIANEISATNSPIIAEQTTTRAVFAPLFWPEALTERCTQ